MKFTWMVRVFALVLLVSTAVAVPGLGRGGSSAATVPGPWDVPALQVAPTISWGTPVDHGDYSVTPLYYDSVEYLGDPTRVFAYYAAPDVVTGALPAVALVHGGGGAAFENWASQWAIAGYAALAMDLFGNGPGGTRLADGGPTLTTATAFTDLATTDLTDMWNYQAVAAVIRGISVLESMPTVDGDSIGIMGISWGGYLTEIVAGLDDRLAFAIPVYGAGFHLDNSHWTNVLLGMDPADRATWVENFDPQQYLPLADVPMRFATGTNDSYFPLDSWRRSVALVPGPVSMRLVPNWPHDYGYPWGVTDFIAFADHIVKGSPALIQVSSATSAGGVASVSYSGPVAVSAATLTYTTSSGDFGSRSWSSTAATVSPSTSTVSAAIPIGTTSHFFTLYDTRGFRVTSMPVDIAAPPGPVVVDNTDAGFAVVSGTWYTSTSLAGRFGADYRYAVTSPTGTAVARWTPQLAVADSYDVSVWYPAAATRCTSCTYTVRSGVDTHTATVDQTASGGQWVRLGTYHLDPAVAVSVEISNRADGTYVQADAVKFELAPAVVVDNSDPGFSVVSGSWITSSGLAGKYGADYRFAVTSTTATAVARWTPVLPLATTYEVSAWFPAAATRCTDCTYTIRSGLSTSIAVVDQTVSGGRWVSLGSHPLDPSGFVAVDISNQANGTYVQADAVRFDPN